MEPNPLASTFNLWSHVGEDEDRQWTNANRSMGHIEASRQQQTMHRDERQSGGKSNERQEPVAPSRLAGWKTWSTYVVANVHSGSLSCLVGSKLCPLTFSMLIEGSVTTHLI